MKNLLNIGRILYALPFGIFGLMHLIMGGQMGGMVPSFIPGGVFWIYVTGLGMLAACISIMAKRMIRLSCLLLGILLLVYILTIHLPGLGSADTMAKMMSMSNLLKDTGLAGGAFILAGLYADQK